MDTQTAAGIESTGATTEVSPAEFQQLKERVTALETDKEHLQTELDETKAELDATQNELEATRAQQRADRHALAREAHELRSELQEYRATNEKDKAEIKQDVHTTSEELQSLRPAVKHLLATTATTADSPEDTSTPTNWTQQNRPTSLEQVCALPDEIAVRELSANQERARFIAQDLTDYVTKVPAGYALTSSDINTILTARREKPGKAHPNTVARVMDFLDQLGDNQTRVVMRHGSKRVIFEEEIVEGLATVETLAPENTRVVIGAVG
jgi:Skp family chaperone for outer membrane proteins